MTNEQKITNAFAKKHWQVSEYDYDRQDGYAVSINTEDYPETEGDTPQSEALHEAYAKAFDKIDRSLMEPGQEYIDCGGGFVLTDTMENVLKIAKMIPDRLSIVA